MPGGRSLISTARLPPKSTCDPLTRRRTVPLWHVDRHVDELRTLWQPHHQPRLDRRDFDAVRIVDAPLLQMILHVDHVLVILGHGQPNVAVRAAAVIVTGHARSADAIDVQHRIERRANPPGQHWRTSNCCPFLAVNLKQSTSPAARSRPPERSAPRTGSPWPDRYSARLRFGSIVRPNERHSARERCPGHPGRRNRTSALARPATRFAVRSPATSPK